MSAEVGRFVTVVACMDGRIQLPVNEWLRNRCQAKFVDTITEAGPDRIMAEKVSPNLESIKQRVMISVERHGSETIALVAHGDCAGNPVSREEHLDHLKRGLEVLRSWELNAELLGLWVDPDGWKVYLVPSPA